MNVRLACQVLSSTVSTILGSYGSPEAAGTSRYCSMFDSFFDILNVRNTTEGDHKRKPFLQPFRKADDPRFQWLRDVFLPYFESWKDSINSRPGNFNLNDRNKMFISSQTHEGIKITSLSIIEVVPYLLQQGFEYVLTERFCQDPLENYFGRQRAIGARKDNPSVRDFGFNDNSIRIQKSFCPIRSGNSRDVTTMEINDDPVPCRKKKR